MVDLQFLSHILVMEREVEELQKIENDFYVKVAKYVTELETRRAGCTDYASESIVADELKSVRTLVDDIHNRRVMKILELAFIASSGAPVPVDMMVDSERVMFDEIMAAVNREKVNLKNITYR